MFVTNSVWCSDAVLVYDVLRVHAPGFVLWSVEASSQESRNSSNRFPVRSVQVNGYFCIPIGLFYGVISRHHAYWRAQVLSADDSPRAASK
jgi:hypothetical protein